MQTGLKNSKKNMIQNLTGNKIGFNDKFLYAQFTDGKACY